MNASWETVVSELGLSGMCERDVHPHDPRERAELFHVRNDSGSTEFEFLNLLHAFTMTIKPDLVLETGTFTGMGTVAIAHALSWNGFGRLLTVDLEDCAEAKAVVQRYALAHLVEFIQSDSKEFCATYSGNPFDMAFIDSGDGRLIESNALCQRSKLTKGAPVFVHDTSPFRVGMATSWNEIFEKESVMGGHNIALSRGIRIMFSSST